MPATAPLTPPGITIQRRAYANSSWAPAARHSIRSSQPDATASDPTGNTNFNAENLEAASGQFWGVMGLTLNQNGYAWDFESALKDPAQTTGRAHLPRQGRRHLPRFTR